jgi:hypothetical protein
MGIMETYACISKYLVWLVEGRISGQFDIDVYFRPFWMPKHSTWNMGTLIFQKIVNIFLKM